MIDLYQYVIGIGSNIDPYTNIKKSQVELQGIGNILKCATLVETAPLGFLDQAFFVNGACLFETKLNETALNKALKDIEKRLGRIKTANKNGPRTIDLDIVVVGKKVIDEDFYKRDFLKTAVLEVLPNVVF